MSRDFSSTYHKHLIRLKVKNQKQKPKPQSTSRWVSSDATIDDVLKLMEIKARQLVFQSFNPRDFGADYDIVSIPKDNTPEADFWLQSDNTNPTF
jgi:hypothetical protein